MDQNIDDGTPLATAPAMRARLLGPLEITVGDRVIASRSWPGRSSRSLIFLLLGTPDHRLHRDQVLHFLWPELSPAAALNALYKALHSLRRTLEPALKTGKSSAYIELAGDVIGFRQACDIWIDADAFEASTTDAMTVAPAERRQLLRQALELYRGDFLVDEPYADWPVIRREFLRQRRNHAVIALAALDLEAAEPLVSVAALEQVLAADCTVEEAYRALMRAYAAAGQRDEALKQFERCRTNLAGELGVDPHPDTLALRAKIADAPTIISTYSPPASARGLSSFYNLPAPPTPIVGRAKEIDAIQTLLWRPDVRLVTLTGTGGVGKTRLAFEAAAGLTTDFEDGIALVALSSVHDSTLVIPTIARTLGLREEPGRPPLELVQGYLRERNLLLVLDNFEQVLDAACALAELLASCPRIKILATSRHPLNIRAEHEKTILPLAVPDLDHIPRPSALERYDAIALFLQRVRMSRPEFTVDASNASAIAEICVRLDGLPLAIELAAARLRSLPIDDIRAQLAHHLDLLTVGPQDLPERQQALRSTIAWSYDLLLPMEQAIFRRLAVFSGGCTLKAAESVAGSQLLEPIVEHNLLLQIDRDDDPSQQRLTMLDTIRSFAWERLRADGEDEATRDRLTDWCLSLAEEAAPKLTGPDQGLWLDRLERELPNFRESLSWVTATERPAFGLRLVNALWWFWWMRGHVLEAGQWHDSVLSIPGAEAPTLERAAALTGAAGLATARGDVGRAESAAREAEYLADKLGDLPTSAFASLGLCYLYQRTHHPDAVPQCERCLERYRTIDDIRGLGSTLTTLGHAYRCIGNHQGARAMYAECLDLARRAEDPQGTGASLAGLGMVAQELGNLEEARERFLEALSFFREISDRGNVVHYLESIAAVLAGQGQSGDGARLIGAASAIREAIGVPVAEPDRLARDTAVALLQSQLGDDAYAIALAAGSSLDMDEAIAKALSALASPLGI